MIHKYKLHHLTIFTDNSLDVNHKQQTSLLQNVASKIPLIVIDLTEMKRAGNNRLLELPVYQNPRTSTAYVILQHGKLYLSEIYNTLRAFVVISPVQPRPKCLLILYSTENWSEHELKYTLNHVWSLKSLDFTILNVITANHIIYFNYNPFLEIYNIDHLETAIDIFPDKLKNMNDYPLKLPFFGIPPFLLLTKENSGEIVGSGSSYLFLETMSKKLHFSVRFIDSNYSHVPSKIFDQLENNKTLNMLLSPITISTHIIWKKCCIGKC